jgi:hypothetical protein
MTGKKLTIHIHLAPKFKNTWGFTTTPYVFMPWCFNKHKDNFTLPEYKNRPLSAQLGSKGR